MYNQGEFKSCAAQLFAVARRLICFGFPIFLKVYIKVIRRLCLGETVATVTLLVVKIRYFDCSFTILL